MKQGSNEAAYELFLQIGSQLNAGKPGSIFGVPAFKTNKKAFMMIRLDCLIVKLPGNLRQEMLAKDGIDPFAPMGEGKVMGEWIQLDFSHATDWDYCARTSMEYVNSLLK